MIATQYSIGLPRDYDMTVIRNRVATRGHALDDYAGLGIKAYLIRDVTNGAPTNAYAPLYLWTDEAAAAKFLWGGDGFGGIVRDFGRPRVRTWIGGRHLAGAAHGTTPTAAVKSTLMIPRDLDPRATADEAQAVAQTLLDKEDLHSVTWAIDPMSWELLVLTLHSTPRHGRAGAEPAYRSSPFQAWPSADSTTYDVLHLSAPEIDSLTQ
jgi:hypothetical protein